MKLESNRIECPYCNKPMQASTADNPRVWACEPCCYVTLTGLPIQVMLLDPDKPEELHDALKQVFGE